MATTMFAVPNDKRGVLRDPLIEHVPGREPELRLEQQHDPERKEEDAENERGCADDDGAANERRYVHRVSVRANSPACRGRSGVPGSRRVTWRSG